MYPFMREPPLERIADYSPGWLCAAAAEASLPIVLHLTRPLTQCWREVRALAEAHPTLRIDLAHMGRVGLDESGVEEAFEAMVDLDTVVMDSSMVSVARVFELAFNTIGHERVMFGSDVPFNLLRFLPVEDPDLGRVNASPHDYHWSHAEGQRRYRDRARSVDIMHFQSVCAVIEAVDRSHSQDSEAVLGRIFDGNARKWLAADR